MSRRMRMVNETRLQACMVGLAAAWAVAGELCAAAGHAAVGSLLVAGALGVASAELLRRMALSRSREVEYPEQRP